MAQLNIRLLGGFDVRLDGRPVTDFESDTTRALLARLAAEPGLRVSRSALAGMLWPHRAGDVALANLRHSLSVARHAIADCNHTVLANVHGGLRLRTGPDVEVDVAELRRLAATEPGDPGDVDAWERAARLRRGPLLHGFDASPSVAWDDWLLTVRHELDEIVGGVLERLADTYERRGDRVGAITAFLRRLAVDPWNEPAHERLVRLLAADGRIDEALRSGATFVHDLRRELDVEPGASLTALLAALRTRTPLRPARDP